VPLVPTVVSFWPHPREVLHGDTRLRLDLPEEKLDLLAPLGIRQLVLVPFTLELAALTPEAFVERVLAEQLQVRRVAVGENFRFGAGRCGSAADLERIGASCGMEVSVLPMLWDGPERVSSSRIRRALAAGDLAEAKRLLQRPYRFSGRVVAGRGLGRGLGWPTANLQVWPQVSAGGRGLRRVGLAGGGSGRSDGRSDEPRPPAHGRSPRPFGGGGAPARSGP
jgi:riboflavin kinase/FMN adenylyltransferase